MNATWLDRFALLRHKFFSSRPTIELQAEPADCGYVCISAIFALCGEDRRVSDIKALGGTTSRGLTLKQIRDVSRRCGLAAEAIAFRKERLETLHFPVILLLVRSHYVVAARCVAGALEVYDPGMGWYWISAQKLRRRSTIYAIEFDLPIAGSACRAETPVKQPAPHPYELGRLLRRRDGRRALAVVASAQILGLAIPLLSMLAVDRSTAGRQLSTFGAIGILFVALSVTSVIAGLFGELSGIKLKRAVEVDASRLIFRRLSEKSSGWFARYSPASIKNLIDSYYVQIDFYLDMLKAIGGIALGLVFGAAILLFVSPWLAVPGLIGLAMTSLVDLIVNRHQRSRIATSLEASQRRQRFVLDVLCQMPELIRAGVGRSARTRFTSVVRSASAAEAGLYSLQGWRTALLGAVRSGEQLLFVTVSALFWAKGEYSLGAFVALGAYKDLMAQNLNALLQLHLRKRAIDVHRLQASPLLEQGTAAQEAMSPVEQGHLVVRDTAFRYGSLDPFVFRGCSLQVEPGEFVAIRGPSGAGKSTFARLLVGAAQPDEGSVLVDGLLPAMGRPGIAAVLQTDRLISADILGNVLYFRDHLGVEPAIEALKAVELYDFVMSLPMRWKTPIFEGGGGLSGGQRQRILLARAIVGRPRLLVLDEATSSLEVEVERLIVAKLSRSGVTIVMVAHRPEVWAMADRTYNFTAEGLELCSDDELLSASTILPTNTHTNRPSEYRPSV